jgi:hypothetical protein
MQIFVSRSHMSQGLARFRCRRLISFLHEIARELLEAIEKHVPRSTLGQEYDGVPRFLDEHLIALEAKLFR